jgi:hypothetical protein
MRLDVSDARASRAREGCQRADLVQRHCMRFVRRHTQFAAAKPLQIRQRHMRADRHAVSFRKKYSLAHCGEVAGMETAGNIREVIHGMTSASWPMRHAPNDSPMSQLRSMTLAGRRAEGLRLGSDMVQRFRRSVMVWISAARARSR